VRSACVLFVLISASPAYAASSSGAHMPLIAGDVLGIGHLVGSVFSGLGHAVLGAFPWTIGLATKFILVTLGALVRMLIPRSWAQDGVQIMHWIVQVPDYAGQVTSATGHTGYGFAGVNDLRLLFTWIGIALLPLTLVYATSRSMLGEGDPVAAPIVRVLALAGVLVSYPYWWAQGAALVNQLTYIVLSLAPVTDGLHKLMVFTVEGVGLGGWQLVDLGLMAALGLELLALIFLKVAIILLGAILFATGPLMLGLVPTSAGHAIARAWASAVMTLLALPIAWATVFAVGAVLINDSSTAGPLISGHTDIGGLLGGVLLAVTGLATLWLCLKAAREAGSLLRLQIGGLLVLARQHRGGTQQATSGQAAASTGSHDARSIRAFGQRVGTAAAAAEAAGVDASPRVGGALARVGSAAGAAGRRGVLGSAAVGAGRVGAKAVPTAARVVGRSRAGAVAVHYRSRVNTDPSSPVEN
jgi:hypothetical protein